MPNHCYNGMTIKGDSAKVTEIFNKHFPADENGVHHFDFNTLIEYPKEFKDQDEIAKKARSASPPDYSIKDGYNSGGYEWCIENWGTKWNAYDQEVEDYGDGYIRAEFYTAWSPPQEIFKKLCELYPDLEINISYEEAGMAFEGLFENFNGELINTMHINDSKRILRGG